MAELPKTEVLARARHGDAFEATYRVTCTGSAADEWLVTPFSQVYAAYALVEGATGFGSSVVLNAEGTGETEGTAPGAVGVERAVGGDLLVTVVGR